jgi:signal transduction histidine kinase
MKPRKWAFWVLFRSLLLALFLMLAAATAQARVITIDHAEVLDSPTPPSADVTFTPVSLPMRWVSTDPKLARRFIKLKFQLDQVPAESQMMYVPRLYSGGAFKLNGLEVSGRKQSDDDEIVHWRRPFQVTLPAALLLVGSNEILIDTYVYNGLNGMSRVYLGSRDELTPRFEQTLFFTYTATRASALISLLFGAAFLWLFWLRRDQMIYGLLGWAALFWFVRCLYFWYEIIPTDWRLAWRACYYLGYGGFATMMMMAVMRIVNRRYLWMERAAMAHAALGVLALFTGLVTPDGVFEQVWPIGLVLIGLACIALLADESWRAPSMEVIGLLTALVVLLAMSMNDFFITIGWISFDAPVASHFTAPIVMTVMGGVLLSRYAQMMNRTENANIELARRVAERERQLQNKFDEQYLLERRRIALEERARIMQDMHDGLGSQLLSSLVMVERSEVSKPEMVSILRDALDDLRLAIDAFAPDGAELLPALGNLRFRMQSRFKAAGINLRWSVVNVPDTFPLPGSATLPILRILQESLTNILKHAHCTETTVLITTRVTPASLLITIADNGKGFDTSDPPGRGRGLPNLRKRGNRIGGELTVQSSPQGTTVSLSIPLDGSTFG